MNFVVVYNSLSGRSLKQHELLKAFERAGHTVEKIFDIKQGLEELDDYQNQNNIVIAGYGGDGTMSAVASKLAGKDTWFAPLSGGTLNHFTKDLGIAQDLDVALATLHTSKPRRIDIATVNERVFLNNSNMGLYPSSLQMRDEMQRKKTNKWVAAIIANFKAFVQYRSYDIEISGERFKTPFVFVGNNDYELENRLIGNRHRLDDGILSVYSIVAKDRWGLFIIVVRAIFGRLEAIDEVKIWKTDRVVVRTSQEIVRISRDGEHERLQSPLVYTIQPKQLNVIGSS